MGMTAIEKILAQASKRDRVAPGDIVYPSPELVFVHDGYAETVGRELEAIGVERLFDPDRVVVVTDHQVLYGSARAARRGKAIRAFAERYGIRQFFDVGQGGLGHVFPVSHGLVLPGMFIFAYDMHCTNFGAVGALAMRNGTEVVSVLATGTVWTKVPSSIRIDLKGTLREGVYVRDLSARISADLALGRLQVDPDYKAIEFGGPGLDQFSTDARMTLCNSPTEVGVATCFVPPSQEILLQMQTVAQRSFTPVYSDPDARFEAVLEYSMDDLEPMVACPPSPENLVNVGAVAGTRVDQAVIGSCASGLYEDMVIAAQILRRGRVANHVRLIITPATDDIFNRCLREGLVQIFQEAGAVLTPPGCGPCAGGAMGLLAPGEVSITTVTQNHPGRMGAHDASIYIGSPATVAASALAGKIVDPREYL